MDLNENWVLESKDVENDITVLRSSDGGELIIKGTPSPERCKEFIKHILASKRKGIKSREMLKHKSRDC
ncbi:MULTISPECIES: hypothetical protein [unclassified Paenibacillus]|uniref:hypothetical protein n=1 Tax=unclassified Paenibacillus TaxID=185978 RepID=UPI001AEA68F9|nr:MULTISPECIES: hypothetical protein [unclassified Paenibacillus]MBP1155207.1 hypothetical protein [Paenibacillus sp. PvP091]MBP1169409.1 hypothetical protein [Paenibacillus sp. PvR098]MBP2440437.1 hypothetical protein [Paenibacillus sp. PvP052]